MVSTTVVPPSASSAGTPGGPGGRRVEARRGLVEEEGARSGEQLDRQADPLALAPAEVADTHGGAVAEGQRGEDTSTAPSTSLLVALGRRRRAA